jgi:TrmH family RNA methyltransferase
VARPDDARALVVARTARARLEAARVAATLDEAVAGASYVVGFSARRGAERPMVQVTALPSLLAERGGRIALVFGPEDAGLSAAEVDRCDVVATIEVPGELPSLNLTQAVAIALWELARAGVAAARARATATRAEVDALVAHAARVAPRWLEEERHRVHLRRVLTEAGIDSADVRALHGVLQALVR